MTRLRRVLAAWLTVCCLMAAQAADVPTLTGRVVDAAGVLKTAELAYLEAQLSDFEARSGAQMAVLFEQHLPETDTVETRALHVAETWGLGQKGKDNGVLLYFAVADRQNRLEVGYGLEGQLTDAQAGDILRTMVPFLRQGRYADAATLAIQMVSFRVTGERGPLPHGANKEKLPQRGSTWVHLLEVGIIVIGVIVFFLVGGGRGGGGFFISGGGFSGGGGGFSGGGFSGGGGGFGGGGASGKW